MTSEAGKRGRPTKHREFDALFESCPSEMRRPKYHQRVGVRRGDKGDTVWVKVQLPHGGVWQGREYPPNHALEIKLGWKSSVTWDNALAKRDEYQRRADNEEPLEDQKAPTFEVIARDWLSRREKTIKSVSTTKGHIDKYLIPEFGMKRMDTITPKMIEHWISRKRTDGLSSSYIKRIINTFKSILNDAKRCGIIDSNAATKIVPLKGIAARQRFLQADEIVRLLHASEEAEPWMYDAVIWALHSGMRRGEIQSMKWQDIRKLDSGGAVVLLENTKSGKPRHVTCTNAMLEVLERQSSRRKPGDERVFPISEMTWRRRWETVREQAQLADIDFHDLRRTNATQAAASGVDMRTLAARIGHSDLTMLQKHYAMVVGSAEYEAAKKIGDTFDRIARNVVGIKAKSKP